MREPWPFYKQDITTSKILKKIMRFWMCYRMRNFYILIKRHTITVKHAI
jgi:hypothetical protein